MKEAETERYLKKKIEALGGLCLKFVSPGNDGVPDRIVIFPKGEVCFVELKAPGAKLKPLQRYWQQQLLNRMVIAGSASSKEEVDGFIESCKRYGYF